MILIDFQFDNIIVHRALSRIIDMSYDEIEQLRFFKCKSYNFKRRCTAANKSHIFFSSCTFFLKNIFYCNDLN